MMFKVIFLGKFWSQITLHPCLLLTIVVSFSFSSDDQDVLEWDEKSWRDADWVESSECKLVMGWDDGANPADFIYQENPDLQQYR